MSEKICTCKEPGINQTLPEGFEGTIRCNTCGGTANYPNKIAVYKGDDVVEEFRSIRRQKRIVDFETVLVELLWRILKALLPDEEIKKRGK